MRGGWFVICPFRSVASSGLTMFTEAHEALRLTFHDAIGFSQSGKLKYVVLFSAIRCDTDLF